MKKILSIIIVISCLALMCSCSMINSAKRAVGLGPKVSDFEEAMANTNASSVIINITSKKSLGTLNTSITVYYKADGSAIINYSYEKFNAIGEGEADEIKSTIKGTVTRNADGSCSEAVDLDFSTIAAYPVIDLSEFSKSAKINDSGDVLEVKIPASRTEAVLGTAINEDVNLKMTLKDGAVGFVELNYASGSAYYQYAK